MRSWLLFLLLLFVAVSFVQTNPFLDRNCTAYASPSDVRNSMENPNPSLCQYWIFIDEEMPVVLKSGLSTTLHFAVLGTPTAENNQTKFQIVTSSLAGFSPNAVGVHLYEPFRIPLIFNDYDRYVVTLSEKNDKACSASFTIDIVHPEEFAKTNGLALMCMVDNECPSSYAGETRFDCTTEILGFWNPKNTLKHVHMARLFDKRDTLFFFHFGLERAPEIAARRKVGIVLESPVILDAVTGNSIFMENSQLFDIIFTNSKEVLDQIENSYFFPASLLNEWAGHYTPDKWHIPDRTSKTGLVSMIVPLKQKTQTQGHLMRWNVWNYVRDRQFGQDGSAAVTVDAFWYPLSPVDSMMNHMFSIIVENHAEDYYFSNKLVNCFIAGTIPIYWGMPSLERFFDSRGFITFNSLEELQAILSSLTPLEWEKRLPYMQRNLAIARRNWSFPDYIFENFEFLLQPIDAVQSSIACHPPAHVDGNEVPEGHMRIATKIDRLRITFNVTLDKAQYEWAKILMFVNETLLLTAVSSHSADFELTINANSCHSFVFLTIFDRDYLHEAEMEVSGCQESTICSNDTEAVTLQMKKLSCTLRHKEGQDDAISSISEAVSRARWISSGRRVRECVLEQNGSKECSWLDEVEDPELRKYIWTAL